MTCCINSSVNINSKSNSLIPTLHERYDEKFQQILESKIKENPKLIFEVIDLDQLRKVNKILKKMNDLIQPYDLPELKRGIRSATQALSKARNPNDLLQSRPSVIANWLLGWGNVSALETGLVNGFQALPDIVEFMENLAADNPIQDDERISKRFSTTTMPDHSLVDKVAGNPRFVLDLLKNKIKEAFRPPGVLSWVRGLPYVNDNKMVEEILNLKFADIKSIAGNATKYDLRMPVDRETVKKAAELTKTAREDPKKAAEDLKASMVADKKEASAAAKPDKKEVPALYEEDFYFAIEDAYTYAVGKSLDDISRVDEKRIAKMTEKLGRNLRKFGINIRAQ